MLETLAKDTAPETILEVLERDGGVIVEGLLDAQQTARLRAEFAPHLDAVEWCNLEETGDPLGAPFFGRKTKRLHGLLARSPAYGELVSDPWLVGLARLRLTRGPDDDPHGSAAWIRRKPPRGPPRSNGSGPGG